MLVKLLVTKKKLESAINDLTLISGQKVSVTKAKKSVATFKLRDGMNIGCKVTLRKERMYEFLDRLINISLPRVRDFRGLSAKSFDGRGNYALGIKEQIVFPEINYDDVDTIRGLDIIICTSARNNDDGLALLKKFNFPFRNLVKDEESHLEDINTDISSLTEAIERLNDEKFKLNSELEAKQAKLNDGKNSIEVIFGQTTIFNEQLEELGVKFDNILEEDKEYSLSDRKKMRIR